MKKILGLTSLILLIFPGCDNETVTPNEVRLDHYIQSFENNGQSFQPQVRVDYEYDGAGRLQRIVQSGYNQSSAVFDQQRYSVFSYVNEKVDNIKVYLTGSAGIYASYSYQYNSDGTVSRINENNSATKLTSEANFVYNTPDKSVKVNYTYSNGGAFEYEFQFGTSNITSDKTTRGTELCSNGNYTYDQEVNPLSKLGYVDYELFNLSVNNKLTENVTYVACSFPSLMPSSYSYEYEGHGYPTTATTLYNGSSLRSKKEFFYTTGQ